MTINAYMAVTGAPDAAQVAVVVHQALGGTRTFTGAGWQIDGPDWYADVLADPAPEPGEAPLLVVVWHESKEASQLHALIGRLFAFAARATPWTLRTDSDLEPYAEQYRPTRA
ncbi:hypothetical protein H9651_00545 [Microbacterium sp. Sa4CUA7]|uniref:DUF3574 domain-containing protein n=1 Tax=Microbacterium pullorum TaxID=2762236 RepID=A0ABR8RY10_9MICO|nr:hypothetical protein [Microbacterium pullorum]MBD7956127.1 hypothetical protein [Microbacterium pullorum]